MLSNRRLVAVCAIALCCNIAGMVLFAKYNVGERCFASLDRAQPVVATVPDDFLSFGIDTSELRDGGRVDWGSGRLRALARHLAPARLRLGGTLSERLVFSLDEAPVSCRHCPTDAATRSLCHAVKKLCKHKTLPLVLLTANKWNEVNNFCRSAGLRLLFTFNVLVRDHNEWNEQNALELLNYTKRNGFDADWQLGNEPNSFRHVFNMTVFPRALANDFHKLRKILNNHGFQNSLVVGPDTTRPQPQRPECLQYMEEFLGNGSQYISVRSWHQYYVNSRTASLQEFWDPATLNLLESQIEAMKEHTANYTYIPMWLSETSSSYGGGAPGLSDSYAGSALWLDKLGLSARYNISTVVRQSLYGGNYSLIDKDLNPLPDWWISLIFKKLVGNKVLHVECECSRYQRMYAHCTNPKYTNDTTAVTIYAVNLEMAKARILLNGTAFPGEDLTIDEFILSVPSNNRRSKTVLLNGWPLEYESSLAEVKPHIRKYGKHISMPPYSIGFWVVRNTAISSCN